MQRLKKRSEFLAAARAGKAAMPGLVMQARPRGDDLPPRAGFTASKKVGNAVARNRAKRRMRVLARQVVAKLARPGFDYVLIARAATIDRRFADLVQDAQNALERLHRQHDSKERAA